MYLWECLCTHTRTHMYNCERAKERMYQLLWHWWFHFSNVWTNPKLNVKKTFDMSGSRLHVQMHIWIHKYTNTSSYLRHHYWTKENLPPLQLLMKGKGGSMTIWQWNVSIFVKENSTLWKLAPIPKLTLQSNSFNSHLIVNN